MGSKCEERDIFIEDVFSRIRDEIDNPLLRECINRIGRAKLTDEDAASLCVLLHVLQTVNESKQKTIDALQAKLRSFSMPKHKEFLPHDERRPNEIDPSSFAGRYHGRRPLH